MVLLAVLQSHLGNRSTETTDLKAPLIQGLDTNTISAIELGSSGQEVTLKRTPDGFVVANKENYPAVYSKINNLITSCVDIEVRDLITKNPQNHEDLEVTESKSKNVVKFLDKDDKLITGVVIGKRNEQGQTFVRRIGSDEVYLSDNPGWLQMSATSYIDKDIYKVDKEKIARVTVSSPGESYTIKRGPDNKIVLDNIPAGKKVKGTDYESVFTAITNLTAADVQKETQDLKFDMTYICKLKDSTICTFKLAKKGTKTYAKCNAQFTDTGKIVISKEESKEELEKKEAKLLARDEAAKFTQKHKGWVYEIASWQSDNMTKKLSDLLEEIKKEEAPKKPPAIPNK